MFRFAHLALGCLLAASGIAQETHSSIESPYARWTNGPSADPHFFPICVWLQDPKNADRYKAAGINIYVGLWRGPSETQLSQLEKAGMRVICGQNEAALRNKSNPVIIGWMHGDEPDNAQSLGKGKGYGPPIKPEVIVQDYQRIVANDSSRPVLLNLGQGVAWDNYIGRGVRRNHPEDYPEYIKGGNIVSFDIYPVVHDSRDIAGKLEYVAQGVDRLIHWGEGNKIVWNCIECTHIGNAKVKATPEQVRSEVWMSLIHGSRGIIYFVHQFEPNFREAALLDDAEMLSAVTAINRQIQSLAPVLNSPDLHDALTFTADPAEAPIATRVKHYDNATYIFAAAMRNQPTRGQFQLKIKSTQKPAKAEVLEESRTISINAEGSFEDTFKPYAVHLYRVLD